MSDKLSDPLPCPFCGGRASSSQQTTGGRWAAYCLDCEAMVDGEFSEPDAIAAWNRRASPAPAISESEDAELIPMPAEPDDAMQLAGAQAIRFETTPINKIWTANAVYRAMVAARKGEKS
ncbi:Lar family restriction alleviation protein [Burkholderia gladioli]|uniref:Lar family restriction alleviation protein n=1 Tax=Burkholderia gladioli TaxID=28095 RepID=UPI002866DAD9|nr:Lar family restriction alleviation protein [Burkholderia gladioli]MDR8087836.1 Lar family restriction alleviation protein [Burkholderia gladioli]